jgi:carbonic anhydrase/acetyltransferase-like protein (isoleucine patch superfamily)
MLVEHRGQSPTVHESAWVAPNAVVSGNVTIGERSRILYGAVLTAEGNAAMSIGRDCVVMEHAVLRAAGPFDLSLDDQVLVGPHAYLTGCSVGPQCFLATGSMVFNGAALGRACVVALDGKVHIDTELTDEARIPIGFAAFGRPASIYAPHETPELHEELNKLNFMRYVFGVEPNGKARAEVMAEAMSKYARVVEGHRGDKVLGPTGP